MAVKSLRWSASASGENGKLTYYLLSEWGEKVALRVSDQIDKTAERIQQTPDQFPLLSEHKNVRRAVISPQTSIFFKVYRTEIVIISVFDNRQHPKKRKL